MFNLFSRETAEQKAESERGHAAFWEERGREHGQFWKNSMDLLVKVALSVISSSNPSLSVFATKI